MDAELNTWYNDFHLRDCLDGIFGYSMAQRFRIVHESCAGVRAGWDYAALYELDADSLADVFLSVEEFKRLGRYERPGGRVAPGLVTWVYSSNEGERSVLEWCEPGERLCLCFSQATHSWLEEQIAAGPGDRVGRLARATQQRFGTSPPWERLSLHRASAEAIDELVARRSRAALGGDHAAWVLAPISELLHGEPAAAAG